MLKLETPNLHEIGLDRVIAYGHTWSPLHELIPETPFRHGHAISIDMAYSATLANSRGLLSDEDHRRILNLFSKAGLSMDHHQFDEEVLEKGTAAILKTRDGKLRAAVPSPLGKCVFINDVTMDEMIDALNRHKKLMRDYPRNGEGLEAFVDASDTGYTSNNKQEVEALEEAAAKAGNLNGSMATNGSNGHHTNGTNGVTGGKISNGNTKADQVLKEVSANGDDSHVTNGTNGFTNGSRA